MPPSSLPHVVFLVETALGPGRGILQGILRFLREHGRWAIYHEPRTIDQSPPRWLKKWRGDGIIAHIPTREIARVLHATGVPVIDLQGVVEGAGFPIVQNDHRQIAILGAGHLWERGFRNFGFFGARGIRWSAMRRDALRAFLKEKGCGLALFETQQYGYGIDDWEPLEERLAAWIRGLPKPAAVMVATDHRGPFFLEACRRAGVQVPDEVAVIGVDNALLTCELCTPSLSSVEPDFERQGYEAARLLDGWMRTAIRPPDRTLLPPLRVVTRQSTDLIAVKDRAVSLAVKAIREGACSGIRIDAVARASGISRTLLERRFREHLGRTMNAELLRVRLERAKEMLMETDLPMIDIAQKAGFKHQEYMGVVFKRELGTTPGRWRSEGRKGSAQGKLP